MHAQRKFLAPDFGGLHARWLRVGEAVPIDFAPRELLDAEVWEDEGVRLHDASISSELRLLHDLDDLWSCHCGASLAPVLRLRFRDDGALPGLEGSAHRHEVELAAMELRDARAADVLVGVDFASVELVVPFSGDRGTYHEGVQALSRSPPATRAQRIRAALLQTLPPEGWTLPEGATRFHAPMRCDACGTVSQRALSCALSIFGDAWTGGELDREKVIAADPGRWSSEPRHGFYGLRPPPSSGELVIVQARESFGGPCGAGPARMILRFEPVEGGVRLAAVSLRDAHYVFAPGIIGRPHAKCWLDHDLTRDARMRW